MRWDMKHRLIWTFKDKSPCQFAVADAIWKSRFLSGFTSLFLSWQLLYNGLKIFS